MLSLLNGRLRLAPTAPHPPEDALWLAASIPPLPPGTQVLDAACGIGTAALALLMRQPGLAVTGVDINPALTALAAQHATLNALPLVVKTANLTHWHPPHRFACILCNPPFYVAETHTPPTAATRQNTKHIALPQWEVWLTSLLNLLTPGGSLHLILHPSCLPALHAATTGCGGILTLTPLQTAPQKPPKRVLACLTPHAGGGVITQAPLPAYQPTLREAILRHGAALPTPQ